MNPNELKDYQLLKKIQSLCESAKAWDGDVSFESIWQSCSDQIMVLKNNIGERIISEYNE